MLLRERRQGDGSHIGYCTTCGADTFNGPRHRCPNKITERALVLIMAAKQLLEAQRELQASSIGTLGNARALKHRDAMFDALEAAIKAHNAEATVGPS